MRRVWWTLHQLLLSIVFVEAIVRYDVFVFGFGSTFFSFRELPLLRRLGKRIVYVFHGDDSRPPYLSGVQMPAQSELNIAACIAKTQATKEMLSRVEEFADFIIVNPLSAQLHEKQFISFVEVGLPRRDMTIPMTAEPSADEAIRILHAPSDPAAKGTPRIREVIDRLRSKGFAIDFREVRGQPHTVVLNELAQCDFVIDQLYSDVAMSGFSAEAASLGKPAIVGSYAHQDLLHMYRERRVTMPPVQLCHPEQLEAAVETLIVDKQFRHALGKQAYDFVQREWRAKNVAGRYVQLLSGSGPRAWNPREIRYVRGSGITEERISLLLQEMIETGGTASLRVADKPELEHLLVGLARGHRAKSRLSTPNSSEQAPTRLGSE